MLQHVRLGCPGDLLIGQGLAIALGLPARQDLDRTNGAAKERVMRRVPWSCCLAALLMTGGLSRAEILRGVMGIKGAEMS